MHSLEFTIRRKYQPAEGGDKKNYGNHEETVESGPNKGEKVPCILVKYPMTPDNSEELIRQLGGKEENFVKFIDVVTSGLIKDKIRSDIFLKLEETDEQTEEGRKKVLSSIEKLVNEFTLESAIAETLTAKSALDEMNSPEMQQLAATDAVEFARRVKAILSSTRGVKAAA
jgi:hypothetical protein